MKIKTEDETKGIVHKFIQTNLVKKTHAWYVTYHLYIPLPSNECVGFEYRNDLFFPGSWLHTNRLGYLVSIVIIHINVLRVNKSVES